jgi:ubiquinone/menaquinone biosynthesis C-methylase UbiE
MTQALSFDPIWEHKYAAGHVQHYPWDVVVSFVFRHYPRAKPREEIRVLEVGCGTASNLWFAAREGFQVSGIEGSESAVRKAQQRFASEGLVADLRVGDFTKLPFESSVFDLVIDRGALVCCSYQSAQTAIDEIHRVMLPGGRFFFNPYSEHHSSRSSGHTVADGLTHAISEGSMTNVGQICFYSRHHVEAALHNFDILSLQHMEFSDHLQAARNVHAEWRVVAEKSA